MYGCGTATADKWYQRGLRTIEQVKTCEELQLTEAQKLGQHLDIKSTQYMTLYSVGLSYYDDISKAIPREEVGRIVEIIQQEVRPVVLSECSVILVFYRYIIVVPKLL